VRTAENHLIVAFLNGKATMSLVVLYALKAKMLRRHGFFGSLSVADLSLSGGGRVPLTRLIRICCGRAGKRRESNGKF
jgi:hypothetical protein